MPKYKKQNQIKKMRSMRNNKKSNKQQIKNLLNFDIDEEIKDAEERLFSDFDFHFPTFHNPLFDDFDIFLDSFKLLDNKKNTNMLKRKRSNNNNSNNNSTFVTKYCCSKIENNNGKPYEETYESESINQNNDGHKISEKKELYKNTKKGIQKAAQQKILDGKGTKTIKEKNINTGALNEKNIVKGMKKNEVENFNKNFNEYKEKVGFKKNYDLLHKMVRPFDNTLQLEEGKTKKESKPYRRCLTS